MSKRAKRTNNAHKSVSFQDAYLKPKWKAYRKCLSYKGRDNSFKPVSFKTPAMFFASLKNRTRFRFPFWPRLKDYALTHGHRVKTQREIVEALGIKQIKALCRSYRRKSPRMPYYPVLKKNALRDETLACLKLIYKEDQPNWLLNEISHIPDQHTNALFLDAWRTTVSWPGPDFWFTAGPYYEKLFRGPEATWNIATGDGRMLQCINRSELSGDKWMLQVRQYNNAIPIPDIGLNIDPFWVPKSVPSIGLNFRCNWLAFATFYSYCSRREKLYLFPDLWKMIATFVTDPDLFAKPIKTALFCVIKE